MVRLPNGQVGVLVASVDGISVIAITGMDGSAQKNRIYDVVAISDESVSEYVPPPN